MKGKEREALVTGFFFFFFFFWYHAFAEQIILEVNWFSMTTSPCVDPNNAYSDILKQSNFKNSPYIIPETENFVINKEKDG
jgi:hypothetical protein